MRKEKGNVRGLLLAVLAVLTIGGFGCAQMGNVAGVAAAQPIVDQLLAKLLDTSNARVLAEGLPANVVLITGVTEMSPNDRNMLTKCCLAYTAWGMMIEDNDPKFALELYTIGKNYGMRALKTNKKFAKGLAEGKKIPEMVPVLNKKEYAETLCWCALATGLEIMHQMDNPMALMGLPDSISMISQSVKLDPNYFYGVGKAFLAAYYALLPPFLGLGGGPDVSAAMFQEAREVSGGKFLMVDVFEARYLCTYTDNEARFDELMNRALEADSAALKGGRAMNEVAKMKARYFLSIKDTLF